MTQSKGKHIPSAMEDGGSRQDGLGQEARGPREMHRSKGRVEPEGLLALLDAWWLDGWLYAVSRQMYRMTGY